MTINKIIVSIALICSFTVANAVGTGGFKYRYNRVEAGFLIFIPYAAATGLKKTSPTLEKVFGTRIKDAAERGAMYCYLRSQQEYKYFSTRADSDLFWLNTTKENLDSVAQQLGYVAADAIVSEVADRVVQLDPIKGIIQSEPVQYVSSAISDENKKFFKDQAIFVASAALVNGTYQLSEMSQVFLSVHNKSKRSTYLINPCSHELPSQFEQDIYRYHTANLYNQDKGGMTGALVGKVILDSVEHFIVKKYIPESIEWTSPAVSSVLCECMVFPLVKSLLGKK